MKQPTCYKNHNKSWCIDLILTDVGIEVLNKFSQIQSKNLKIPEYDNLNSKIENVKDVVFRGILKYKNHPSTVAIKEILKNAKFSFHEGNKKIAKEIRRLNENKASQKSDIPIRIIKDNADTFAEFLCETVDVVLLKLPNFSNKLKLVDINTYT